MNHVEFAKELHETDKWKDFAEKLRKSLGEYPLSGVTVILRKMTAEEKAQKEGEYVLTFQHKEQRFEVGLDDAAVFPPAWRIADTIDHFLNPDEEAARFDMDRKPE